MSIALKTVVLAAFVALVSGCVDLKPLETEVTSLKNQQAQMQGDLESVKRSVVALNQATGDAQRNAQAASSKADQALAAAQATDAKIAMTQEQMDRMFRRTASK
jgi:hypothetical protein